jgi:hypothetical protein
MENNNNSVIFKIYKLQEKQNEKIFDKEYCIDLKTKISDIKKEILKNSFNNEFNYLDLENITDKIYKDFGKLSFDKGIIPNTTDNYKLEQFTINNREFSFIALPKNIIINKTKKEDSGILKKFVKKELKSNQLFIYDDDFPPL